MTNEPTARVGLRQILHIALVALSVGACGGKNAGVCEKIWESSGLYYCSSDYTEDACEAGDVDGLSSEWHAGESCEDIGYTEQCEFENADEGGWYDPDKASICGCAEPCDD